MDFLIGPDNDWVVENGDVVIVKDAAFIRQTWLIRMRKFQGEWILDEDDGVPYVQEIFGKGTKEHLIAVVRQVTLDTPGVLAVQNITVNSFDAKNRIINVTVEAFIEGPDSAVFRYSGYFATVSECPLTFPLLFSQSRLWIDGQDLEKSTWNGTVTSVINKAATGQGSGAAPVVGASIINGKRAFKFTGSEVLEITDTPAIRHSGMNITLFLVFKSAVSSDGTYGIATLEGITNTGTYERIYVSLRFASGVAYLTITSKRTGEAAVVSEAIIADGAAASIMSMASDASGNIMVEVNGNTVAMLPAAITPRLLNGDYTLGAETSDVGASQNFFNGAIGEIIVYESELSTADINSVTICLGRKWGISVTPSEYYSGYGYFPYGISAYGL